MSERVEMAVPGIEVVQFPPGKPRCTSKFAGCRCCLQAGHSGDHVHDGAAGKFGWGSPRRPKRG